MYDNDEAIFLYGIFKNYKNSFIIFTDKVEADMLWYGTPLPPERIHDLLPTYPSHFMLREKRASFFATQKGNMSYLSTFDFAIGTRIHGIICSILSGIPAMLISTSLRTFEIAQYHNIPVVLRSELSAETSLETLYYKACYGMKNFHDTYDEKLDEYIFFLRENELPISQRLLCSK